MSAKNLPLFGVLLVGCATTAGSPVAPDGTSKPSTAQAPTATVAHVESGEDHAGKVDEPRGDDEHEQPTPDSGDGSPDPNIDASGEQPAEPASTPGGGESARERVIPKQIQDSVAERLRFKSILAALGARRDQIGRCYARARKAKPELSKERLSPVPEISPDGTITAVKITGTTADTTQLEACLTKALRGVKLPPP